MPRGVYIRSAKKSPIERFWNQVLRTDDPNECWLWRGKDICRGGYGRFWISRGNRVSAHRFAYEITHGPIPKNIHACHNCDNPPCVNPAHIFPASQKQNIQDAIAKGRLPVGDNHWTRLRPKNLLRGNDHWARRHPEKIKRGMNHPSQIDPSYFARGEDHGNAKLTELKVRELRFLYDKMSQRALARRFNISRATLRAAALRETWIHVV